MSSNLTKDLGIESGGEFKAAQIAADKVGAQVVLGDRPIEITLKRAWVSLPFQSRVRLVLDLVRSINAHDWKDKEGTIEAVERLKQDDDAVNSLLNALGEKFPQTIDSLVHERDLYLAWSLKRSKAVNGTRNVVGVIGKGHLRGVCYAMTHDPGSLRFKDLVSRNEDTAKANPINSVGRFALESALFIVLWWSYSQLQ
jgi:pheromone shutdown protein TraB